MSFINIFQNYDEQSFKNALNDAISKFTDELTNTLNIEKEVVNKIWLSSMNNKPQVQISTCKYVCSRGKNKGQVCLTKAEENGFCKKHKKQEKTENKNEEKEVEKTEETEHTEKDTENNEQKKETGDNEENTCKFCFKKGKNIGKRCTKKVSKKSVLGYCSTHIKEEKN